MRRYRLQRHEDEWSSAIRCQTASTPSGSDLAGFGSGSAVGSGLWFMLMASTVVQARAPGRTMADTHTWTDLAGSGSGFAVGLCLWSLVGFGTGSGFVAGVRSEDRLGRSLRLSIILKYNKYNTG